MSEVVEAIYQFHPQGDDDMELKPGDRIEISEHLSSDWARGKNLGSGKEGVFPTNYVKPASSEKGFSRPAAAVPQGAPQGFDEKSSYTPPNASWQQQQPPQYQQYQQQPLQQYQQQPPQQYQQPPPQQYQQPPPQQYQQQPPQQAQEQHHHRGRHMFGNIARQFGHSMVFGAGATAGSDIIHKIF